MGSLFDEEYYVAELMLSNSNEVFNLNMNKLSELVGNFEYLSVHAPNPSDFTYGDGSEIEVRVIEALNHLDEMEKFETFVFHADWFEDYSLFDEWDFPVSIENSDWRKKSGKTVEEMEQILKTIQGQMVFDVNHLYTNDKSMKSFDLFLNRFKSDISEFHVSGFSEKERHIPLYSSGQSELEGAIKKTISYDLPVIIESDFGEDNYSTKMKREREYINALMRGDDE